MTAYEQQPSDLCRFLNLSCLWPVSRKSYNFIMSLWSWSPGLLTAPLAGGRSHRLVLRTSVRPDGIVPDPVGPVLLLLALRVVDVIAWERDGASVGVALSMVAVATSALFWR